MLTVCPNFGCERTTEDDKHPRNDHPQKGQLNSNVLSKADWLIETSHCKSLQPLTGPVL